MIEAHILASGSTGNALFFVLGHTRILVDFGISTKRLRESLDQLGHSISQLDGIFITHEHTDHVRGLNTFLRQYGGQIPVFARAGTLARLPGGADCIGSLYQEINGQASLAGVDIESFDIQHDAAEPVGYKMTYKGKKVVCATDLGCVTPGVREALSDADILVFEANHDQQMLDHGPYPYHLKQRVRSNKGHLSNMDAAWTLARLPEKKKRDVFLAHLSQHNNSPEMAVETISEILSQEGYSIGKEFNLHLTWPDRIVSSSWKAGK